MSQDTKLIIIRPSKAVAAKLQLILDIDGHYVQSLPNRVCADIALKNFKYEVKRKVGDAEVRHAIV